MDCPAKNLAWRTYFDYGWEAQAELVWYSRFHSIEAGRF